MTSERKAIFEHVSQLHITLIERWSTPVATLFLGVNQMTGEYVLVAPRSLQDSYMMKGKGIIFVYDDLLERAKTVKDEP